MSCPRRSWERRNSTGDSRCGSARARWPKPAIAGSGAELRQILSNVVAFKLVWFLSLLGAATKLPWLGAAALGFFLLWHFRTSHSPRADLALVGVAALTGLVADTTFIQAGLLIYAEPLPSAELAPFWIIVMWMNFALTVNVALRWLHGRYGLAMVLGLIGGPLAYLAGVELGAAKLNAEPILAYGLIALVWGGAVPLLFWAAEGLNRLWPARLPASSPASRST